MKKLILPFAVLTAFAMAFMSCDNKEEPAKIDVTAVNVTPSPASVVVGATLQLTAEVLPENATDKKTTWGSRDEGTATVDQTGIVTGVAPGEADIWAKAGGITKTVTVTVTAAPIRVVSVTLNKEELPLFVGRTEKLTYTTDPANPTDPAAVWASDNEAAATVAQDGTVTAIAEGTANITVTVDEKTATCEVTVSIPAISTIELPYLKDITTTVAMTGEGFMAGDKVTLADLFGGSTVTADVKNVTVDGAEFDFPATLTKDRSYLLSVMRNGAKQAETYLRYDDDMVNFPAPLGYALTASNEVVNDGSITDINGNVVRGGYVKPASVFQYNEMNWSFDASAADLKLCTFTSTDGALRLNFVHGVTDLTGLKNFDLSAVTALWATDSRIAELDMTMFPNCKELRAWGDPGLGDGRFSSVNFGAYTDEANACKLEHIQLERNQIAGTVDLRNCIYLEDIDISDNQVEAVNLGHASGIAAIDPHMLVINKLIAKNNKLKEIDISNCGRLRQLLLAGNKIERAWLLNNAMTAPSYSPNPDEWFPYMYILKNKEDFSIGWATSADAEGRERHIHVEQYWYRNLSGANKGENGTKESYNRWVNNSPVVQAYNDGFKVTDYYYSTEDGGGIRVKHVHAPGGSLCPAEQDAEL